MNSIYLVLDMQNDLIHPDGPMGQSPMVAQAVERNIVGRTASAVAAARAQDIPVAFVRVAFSDDHREANPDSKVFGPVAKNGVLRASQWGGAVHESLGKRDADWDIVKHRVSPFYNTKLELLLKQKNIERIYCSGVSTHAVVQACVRDAHDRDFDVVVLEDCCAAATLEEHNNSLASIDGFCTVKNSEEAFA